MQAPTTTEGTPSGLDPQARPCAGCGAENTASATFCWRCYRAFEIVPPTSRPTTAPSAWPSFPAPPPEHEVRARAGLGPIGSLVAVALGVVALLAFLTLREPGPSFPDTLADLERSNDPQAEAAARSFRTASNAQGLDADMTFFSDGGAPVAALAWIRGAEPTPGGAPEAFDAFTEGFTSGYNGSVVTTERAERTVEGISYVCAPIVGPVTAGICLWEDEDVFWVLMDVRPGTTIEQTRSLSVTAHAATA